MKKYYLLKYERKGIFVSLNSHTTDYTLYLKVVYWWGLFEKKKEITYPIPNLHPSKEYFNYWDGFIESGKPLPKPTN